MKKPILVIGIFHNADGAIDAIHELRETGISDDQLGFIIRYETEEHQTNTIAQNIISGLLGNAQALSSPVQESNSIGIITSGVIGSILGAIAILRLPDIGPVVVGGTMVATFGNAPLDGITGNFQTLGMPASKINYYEQEFQTGYIILTIKATEQPQDTQNILHYHRAHNIDMH